MSLAFRICLSLVLVFMAPDSAFSGTMNGWRNGGTGVVVGASPPSMRSEDTSQCWKTPTSSWGNASPVTFGGLVCITEEPVSLACFDPDTGARKWTATNDYLDTLPPQERTKLEATLLSLDDDSVRLGELQRESSRLMRELRRSTAGEEIQSQYDRIMSEASAIKARVIENQHFRTPPNKDIIGYSTSTPTVSDGYLYALFGNGVLSKFAEDGRRVWSVWLGKPVEPMLGYDRGHAASPLMVDGVLVVPFAKLSGVDPNSGQVLWTGPKYKHFGTPTIARVGGKAIVVTPGGELVRPSDGAVLGPQLTQIEFVGPVAVGDLVYFVGWVRNEDNSTTTQGFAYQLQWGDSGKLEVSPLWERTLSPERTYATPLVTDDRLYIVYVDGGFEVLGASDGRQLSKFGTVLNARSGSPSPTLGGGRIIIGAESGFLAAYSNEPVPTLVGQLEVEAHRSTPLLVGNRVFVRGFENLYCFE